MTTFPEPQERPDVSSEQRASAELIKRIRKLHWIGMDEEAEQLRHSLRGVARMDVVVAEPRDTD